MMAVIAVLTRTATEASPFDIRLVRRDWHHWGRWINVPVDSARLAGVRVPEWEAEAVRERDFIGENSVDVEDNTVGGYIVRARIGKQWIVGQFLWIEVDFDIRKPGHYWLSFEGKTDRRAYARCSVLVPSPLQNTGSTPNSPVS
jgi:hypothetical protein